MHTMIYVSLITNIVVLIPIVLLMGIKSPLVDTAWGPFTEARGVLWSIYLAILAASLTLVFLPVVSFVVALLTIQIVYKVITPFTVGNVKNPVVISNLLIAAVHLATVAIVFSEVGPGLLLATR